MALGLSAHLAGILEELIQPSLLPRPQPVPPFFLGPHLGNQFPFLVHADVEPCLSSSYSNPAPEGVCLHNELCCQERLGWGGGGYWQLPDLQCCMSLPQLAHPRSSCSKGQMPRPWAPATNILCDSGKVKSPFWASGPSPGFTDGEWMRSWYLNWFMQRGLRAIKLKILFYNQTVMTFVSRLQVNFNLTRIPLPIKRSMRILPTQNIIRTCLTDYYKHPGAVVTSIPEIKHESTLSCF